MSLICGSCLQLWTGDPAWHHQALVREEAPTVPSTSVLGTLPLPFGFCEWLGIDASMWLQDQLERACPEGRAVEGIERET